MIHNRHRNTTTLIIIIPFVNISITQFKNLTILTVKCKPSHKKLIHFLKAKEDSFLYSSLQNLNKTLQNIQQDSQNFHH